MKHSTSFIILYLISLLLIQSCNNEDAENKPTATEVQEVYDKEIGDSSLFRLAIVKSIQIPFPRSFDTLIIKSKWRFLDEIPSDYPINYPETRVDKIPFIDTLSKHLQIKIITDADFNKYMNRVLLNRFKGEYPESLFDICLADNLYLNVVSRRLGDNSFLVRADYRTTDTSIRIENKIMRVGNNWSYKRVSPKL